MNELISLSAGELLEKLKNKELSSKELVTAFLKNIQEKKDLGAFLEVWEEEAIKTSEECDSRGAPSVEYPLNGLPIAVKDIFVTNTGTTTCGSTMLSGYQSPFTATCVQKLIDAGAVILGKTNLDEFAMGSSTENSAFSAVKNPWDLSRVPGGSSGGSSAAVAAHLSPVALGTDTGGSIRQPASFCGITGFKPTYGRISRYGMIAFASSLDQAGPMAKTAEDCALFTEIMSGNDPRDSTSIDKEIGNLTSIDKESMNGLRIGIPKEYFIDGIDSDVSSAIEEVVKQYEKLGAQIVEISLPHTKHAVAVYYVVAPAEASSNLARFDGIRYGNRDQAAESLSDVYLNTRSSGFGKEVQRRILIGTYVLSSGYFDAYYLRAQKVRKLIQQDFHTVFKEKCDLVLCPTAPTTAFKIGEKNSDPLQMYLNDVFTIPASLAGLPAISLPCGFDDKNLPIGFQLIGNAWDEKRVLSAAMSYQQETDWHCQYAK